VRCGGFFLFLAILGLAASANAASMEWACGKCGTETTGYYLYITDLKDNCFGKNMNNIAGKDTCLRLTDSSAKWDVNWNGWTSGSGGGFSYTRVLGASTVQFTHSNYGSEKDGIETGVCITRGISGPVYNACVKMATLNANPAAGIAPLNVAFTGNCYTENPMAPIASCMISLGDGNTLDLNALANPHTYFAENTYTATLTATDSNGMSQGESKTITADSTAPATTASGAPSGWARNDVAVSFGCSDSGSGCKQTAFRVDSDAGEGVSMGGWSIGGSAAFSDGNWALDFNSTDNAGNVEETRRAIVLVDKSVEAPSMNGPAVSADGVTISWNAVSDPLSGLRCYYVYRSTNSGFGIGDSGVAEIAGCSTGTSAADSGLGNATCYYRVKAVDNAGNEAVSGQSGATVNYTPPAPPDTQSPNASWYAPANNSTASGTVALEAIATDDGGVMEVVFFIDGRPIAASAFANQRSKNDFYLIDWNSLTAENGAHNFRARAKDNAGNYGYSGTVRITVDNKPAEPEEQPVPAVLEERQQGGEENNALGAGNAAAGGAIGDAAAGGTAAGFFLMANSTAGWAILLAIAAALAALSLTYWKGKRGGEFDLRSAAGGRFSTHGEKGADRHGGQRWAYK